MEIKGWREERGLGSRDRREDGKRVVGISTYFRAWSVGWER